ncbi:restriction endonuclease subunit S [Belliella sp. R4-6]|uniref:Restriction endonuclease subunit S n=1 Tax=Belliella alkalica TaxID=1730871 RepID=A0ABS9VC18_9BACT|nr:restriction endonuclease subunit S [Belliella alkalica]MCH7413784.1 restriction endonuclease subunit S [Belliella alkalica]
MMEEKLPMGWTQTKLKEVLSVKNGYAFKSQDFKDYGIPVIRISNIQDGQVLIQNSAMVPEELFKKNFVVERGDILVAMSGATTGKYGIYNESEIALQNQRVGNLKPNTDKVSKKFIFYLLGNLKKEIEDVAYGAAQPNISAKMIEELEFLLPPLLEQQRIVAKLDALFGHLDSLREKLDGIPTLLKNFRQQVLTQAVTGELTREWREGKGLEEWEETTIGSLFEVKTGGTPRRGVKEYYEGGTIPWVKSGLVKNELIFEADELITEIAIRDSNVKIFPVDTLLVAMYGEGKTRGQVGWLKIEATTNQAIAALVNETMPTITRTYVFYYCLSQYNDIRAKAEGGNQPNLNLSKVKNWDISMPPLEEQKEIVSQVDALFSMADKIESQYDSLKAKIDQLPQAILAKAFRGELVNVD